MTHAFRLTLRLAAAAAFTVTITISVWLLIMTPHGKTADCATARAMWAYYQSQLVAERAATLDPDASNAKTQVAYQNMVNELQSYADRIHTADIRTEADAIVAINRDMFEQWKRWVGRSQSESTMSTGPTPSDREFGGGFAQNAKKLSDIHAELERRCAR